MRSLICIMVLTLAAQTASAQCAPLMGGHSRFYVEPTFKVSSLQNSPAYWVGGKVGWKVTDHWSLGWAVNALVSHNSAQHLTRDGYRDPYLEMAYTGGVLACSNSPVNRLGIGFDLLWGAGWTELDAQEDYYGHYPTLESTTGTDPFLIFEPSASVILRYTPHFSLNAGVGTMITGGIKRFSFSDADFYRTVWTFGVRVE